MSTPLYQLKAEFSKTLGHSPRIRVLELLSKGEHAVGERLPEVGIEAADLSQHPGVVSRAGLVTTREACPSVVYPLAKPGGGRAAAGGPPDPDRVLAGQAELLAGLHAPAGASGG